MKRILNSFLFPRIISMSNLFFRTFCEKSLRFFKIMNLPHLQLSGLTCFYLCKALDISSSAILCWTYISRRDMYYCQLDVHFCNLSTWSCVSMVHFFWFQALVGLVWSLLYNTTLDYSSVPTCVVHCTWHISLHTCNTRM